MNKLFSENSGAFANSRSVHLKDGEISSEDIYMNEAAETQVTRSKTTQISDPNAAGFRCYRPAAVCLLILVVLLLAAITILGVLLTTERDRLETRYNNLTAEKEQLDISYKKVSEERDQFQKKTDELQNKISQLMKDINTPGWKYFSSSIYFISTEKKSWSEGRHDCIEIGADLVIINSRDEQDFVEMWRRGEGAWIGANDRDSEGVWKWVDGTTLTSGFWSSGEPNNKGDEDCAVSGYRSEPVPNWVDVSCSSEYIWICEKKINS
ncbi:hypothetical protein KOW79_004742 [Hemibagrus wyckioides]|uniref:C-type lectin domain-containing protein n=1 Tax=Hemibagrus wyckioides TaxID=337641 RepID=A0A9D3NXE4_9TELE|nr:hypothetical protein KOW79_004742 [Hemibagrus wyckioides]